MLFFRLQIVLDALPLQMRGKRTASAPAAVWLAPGIARTGIARTWLVIVRIPRLRFGALQFFHKQAQLIRAQLLAGSVMPGFQQLAQQPVGLVQLRRQIHQHLLQDRGILRQALGVDRH